VRDHLTEAIDSMTSSGLSTVEYTLKVLALVFAALCALFKFLDAVHGEEQERVQAWFGTRWQSIVRSNWMDLPERTIGALLASERRLATAALIYLQSNNRASTLTIIGWIVTTGLWAFMRSSVDPSSQSSPRYVSLALMLTLIAIGWGPRGFSREERQAQPRDETGTTPLAPVGRIKAYLVFALVMALCLLVMALALALALGACLAALDWAEGLLSRPASVAAVVLLAITPMTLISGMASGEEGGNVRSVDPLLNMRVLYGVGVGAGLAVTYAALSLGLAATGERVPWTSQLLLSNVLHDGLTVVASYWLLSWALVRRSLLRVPAAIVADVAVSAVLACSSLYVGVMMTERHLGIAQVLHILLARAPDGHHWEVGPYFWAMHTMFLPTLAYLAVVAVCWMAKALLLPTRWFFGVGQEHKNPMNLTAALCALIAALLALLAAVPGYLIKR
jgi:hypothetical protein